MDNQTDALILMDWSTAIGELDSSEAFTKFFFQNRKSLIAEETDSKQSASWKKALMALFHGTAKAKGFKWDKGSRQYVVMPKEVTPMNYGRQSIGY